MAFAQGSRHSLSYIAESTYGTTPGAPSMLATRHTSVSLGMEKDIFVSNEIREDRQIVDARHGNKIVRGSIGIELGYGTFDDFLEGLLFDTWTTNVLKMGTTLKSFSFERRFVDIAQYGIYTGGLFDSASLSIRPNALVTGELGIIAQDAAFSGTSVDASPTAAGTSEPFDSFTGSISEGGSGASNVTGLDLSIENNINPAFVVGAAETAQMLVGQSNVTGTVSFFMEDATEINKFMNETESSLQVVLTDSTPQSLTIDLPRIKYTGAGLDVQNAQDGIVVTMPFQALRDSSEATNLKITRTP